MKDDRHIGQVVWVESRLGFRHTWSPLTIIRVLKRQVCCSNGNTYLLGPGDTRARQRGVGSSAPSITTEDKSKEVAQANAEDADRRRRKGTLQYFEEHLNTLPDETLSQIREMLGLKD